ncbi:MAG: ATP phosphoribosyltransferase [Alphaproteobacteria bacterium CG11_big_fil_rev_8_21_14_0_20_39_49]|nr:MAG: ATP phosphoribosyltransferase [Alphaproteobacteria bacterium CG11_big_fil_rev_8_21_14_0_20_39_49]
MPDKLIIAVPKGRILEELMPLFDKAGIVPEKEFFDSNTRLLRFTTNKSNFDIIRVRSFDVVTFVAFGAAAIGVAGSDVITEFDNDEVYSLLDLGIGKCRMSVAATKGLVKEEDPSRWSHIRVATKYPRTTKEFFAEKGVQTECVKLNGAMELAPKLGLCRRIVDLVSTGATLKSNGLEEIEKIADISSRLIVNRTALKTLGSEINEIVDGFKGAISG